MNTNIIKKSKGFTLLEILLVMALIGILTGILLVSINPNKQLGQARNLNRKSNINDIHNALEFYRVKNKGVILPSITSTYQDICDTGTRTATDALPSTGYCTGKVNLSELVPTYINSIPKDNQETVSGNTGYQVARTSTNQISIRAVRAELGESIVINPFSIVTAGLVLNLDAGDKVSYPGTGTTWFDLSGNNNNGTLINGPTYSSTNGGVIVLDGINDYVDVPINLSTSNYTIMGAARYVTIGGRTFSAKNNNWLMGHWNGGTINYYADNWVDTSYVPSDTNWRIYAATGNYSGDSWELYVNGQPNIGPNNGGVNGPNGFAIGSVTGSGEFSNSHISFLLCYNRVLTASEIQQNFNAIRGRFGL